MHDEMSDRLEWIDDAADHGDFEGALEELEELAKEKSDDPEIWVMLASIRLEADQPEEAMEALARARELGAGPEALLLSVEATALFRQARCEEARERLQSALEQEPERAELWAAMAEITEFIGDEEAAGQADQRAAELDPDHFPLPLRLSEEEFGQRLEQAVKNLPAPVTLLLETIPIVVQPLPSFEMLEELEVPPSILGVALLEDDGDDAEPTEEDDEEILPDAIYIFQRNFERLVVDEEELTRELQEFLAAQLLATLQGPE